MVSMLNTTKETSRNKNQPIKNCIHAEFTGRHGKRGQSTKSGLSGIKVAMHLRDWNSRYLAFFLHGTLLFNNIKVRMTRSE